MDESARVLPNVPAEHIFHGGGVDPPAQLVQQQVVSPDGPGRQWGSVELHCPVPVDDFQREAEQPALHSPCPGGFQHAGHPVGRHQVIVGKEPDQWLVGERDTTLPMPGQVRPPEIPVEAVVDQWES